MKQKQNSLWKEKLKYDPIHAFLNLDNNAITYFSSRDLLEKKVVSIQYIWDLPEVKTILKNQQQNSN